MRYLKLYEAFNDNIDKICQKYKIEDYTINQDGSVDTMCGVNLCAIRLSELPVQFGKVNGYFDCSINQLKTLKYCPHEVTGNFVASINLLKNLKYCPSYVGGKFSVDHNYLINLKNLPPISTDLYIEYNELTSLPKIQDTINGSFICYNNHLNSLVGSPITVKGNFGCSNIPELKSLIGGPKTVNGAYYCTNCNLLDVYGFPEYFGGLIFCGDNPVHEIINLFRENNDKLKFIKYLNEFDVIRDGFRIVEQRLEEAYFMVNKKELPLDKRHFTNYNLI